MSRSIIRLACFALLLCSSACAATQTGDRGAAPTPLCASYPWWGFGQVRKLHVAKLEPGATNDSRTLPAKGSCADRTSPGFRFEGDESDAADFILAAVAHPERGLSTAKELDHGVTSLIAHSGPCSGQSGTCVSGMLEAGDRRTVFFTLLMTAYRDGDDWRYLQYEEGGYVRLYHNH